MVSLLREYTNTHEFLQFLTVLQSLYCWIFVFEWNVVWIKCGNSCSYYIYLATADNSTCWIKLWISHYLEFCGKVDQNIFLHISKILEGSLLIFWKCGVTNCLSSLESPYYGPSCFHFRRKTGYNVLHNRILCDLFGKQRLSHSAWNHLWFLLKMPGFGFCKIFYV